VSPAFRLRVGGWQFVCVRSVLLHLFCFFPPPSVLRVTLFRHSFARFVDERRPLKNFDMRCPEQCVHLHASIGRQKSILKIADVYQWEWKLLDAF
jgi:hypothetical protein